MKIEFKITKREYDNAINHVESNETARIEHEILSESIYNDEKMRKEYKRQLILLAEIFNELQ